MIKSFRKNEKMNQKKLKFHKQNSNLKITRKKKSEKFTKIKLKNCGDKKFRRKIKKNSKKKQKKNKKKSS